MQAAVKGTGPGTGMESAKPTQLRKDPKRGKHVSVGPQGRSLLITQLGSTLWVPPLSKCLTMAGHPGRGPSQTQTKEETFPGGRIQEGCWGGAGGGNQWARSFWATLSWRSRKRRRQMPEPFGSRPDISRQGSGVWRRKGQNGRSSPPSQPHSHHGPGAQANDLVSFSWQPQEAGLLPLLQKARQLGLREVRDQLESHTAER